MIYIIYGEEQYLIDEKIKSIVNQNKSASIDKCASPKSAELSEMLMIPSLFSPQKIIIVDSFDMSLLSSELLSAIKSIPDAIILVFKNPEGMDFRNKLQKELSQKSTVLEYKEIPEWEEETVIDFIVKKFKELKKEISRENAGLIVQSIGRNLSLIDSEIEKIATYLGHKSIVGHVDLENMISAEFWGNFSLINAMFARDNKKALVLLNKMLKDNEEPVKVLSFLSSQFSTLNKVKYLSQKGLNANQMAARLKRVSPYYIKKLIDVAARFSMEEVGAALRNMLESDIRMKSGYNQRLELEMLVANTYSNAEK